MTGEKPDQIHHLPLDSIIPDPDNPRKHFDEREIADLAASIQSLGLAEPIIVRPPEGIDPDGAGPGPLRPYLIVAGERRYRACLSIKLETVPAIIRTDLEDPDKRQALQIVENLQRVNLSTSELVRGIAALVALPGPDGKPLGNPGAAKYTGRSEPWVSRRVKAASCAPEVIDLIDNGHVTDVDLACDLDTLYKKFPKVGAQAIKLFADGTTPRSHLAPWRKTREAVRESLKKCKEHQTEKAAAEAAEKERLAGMSEADIAKEQQAESNEQQRQKDQVKRIKDRRALIERLRPQLKDAEQDFQSRALKKLGDAGRRVHTSAAYLNEWGDDTIPKKWQTCTMYFRLRVPFWYARQLVAADWVPKNASADFIVEPSANMDSLAGAKAWTCIEVELSATAKAAKIEALIDALPDPIEPEAAIAQQLAPIPDWCKGPDEGISRFLNDCAVPEAGASLRGADLQTAYGEWCKAADAEARSNAWLTEAIVARGFNKRHSNGLVFDGLALTSAAGN